MRDSLVRGGEALGRLGRIERRRREEDKGIPQKVRTRTI
jgi:hypothetical protein